MSEIGKRHDHRREAEISRDRDSEKKTTKTKAERVRQCHRYGMHRVGVHASKDDTLLNLPLCVFAIEIINTRGCNFVL